MMRELEIWSALGMIAVLPLVAAGCGRVADPNRPKTCPVSGIVTMSGQPVEGATVSFQPVSGGRGATGTTDSSGRYSLTSFAPGDGAEPGEYLVAIAKFQQPPPQSGAELETYDTPDANTPQPSPTNVLPEKYNDFQTSGLTATVSEGAENNIDFALQ